MTGLRSLPSVDQLLQTQDVQEWIAVYGRPLTLEALRETLEAARSAYPSQGQLPGREALMAQVKERLVSWTTTSLQPLINASGVILHTNLGRAPLSYSAIQAIQEIAQGYTNLEYDLEQGRRGSRLVHAEALLKRLTGAEAALVVNNNTAAVLSFEQPAMTVANSAVANSWPNFIIRDSRLLTAMVRRRMTTLTRPSRVKCFRRGQNSAELTLHFWQGE